MTKILVVEDDPLLLMLAVDLVHDAGFEALEASNADDALHLLELSGDVGVMWTDIDMPGSMNGLELAARVRDRWPPIEILIVSGKHTLRTMDLPVRGEFVSKPYDPRSVTEALRRMAA